MRIFAVLFFGEHPTGFCFMVAGWDSLYKFATMECMILARAVEAGHLGADTLASPPAWSRRMRDPQYAARICWNSASWQRPTGEAARLEQSTWATEHGFGLEEWLNRKDWLLDGWHYSWIQGVAQTSQVKANDVIDVALYAIKPGVGRVWVGRIAEVSILNRRTDEERIMAAYRQEEWLEIMSDDIRALTGNEYDYSEGFVNVRFRPESLSIRPSYEIAASNDPIQRCNHYHLYERPVGLHIN